MNILTHRKEQIDVSLVIDTLREQIIQDGDLFEASVKDQLEIIDELLKFDYGRWLLVNRGLNAQWSKYFYHYSIYGHFPSMQSQLEIFMTQKAPGVLASYEQLQIQNEHLLKYISSDMCIASVPCGYMDLLLNLDISKYENITLVGIDLDPNAIEGAKTNAIALSKENCCKFIEKDAWDINICDQFDILVSNGLNMYAPTEAALINLYKNFYDAIKPNGYLFLSALTAPLNSNGEVYWNMDKINLSDLKMQKLIFNNVIKVRQGVLCTEQQTVVQLEKVGFKRVDVIHDSRKMFLSIIALK